jgi:hypothetical protein
VVGYQRYFSTGSLAGHMALLVDKDRAWLDDEKKHLPARFALRERLFEALRAAGVEMPFETFALAPVEVHGAATEPKWKTPRG